MVSTIEKVLSRMLQPNSNSFSHMETEALPLNNTYNNNSSSLKVRVMDNLKIYSGAEVNTLDNIHNVTLN